MTEMNPNNVVCVVKAPDGHEVGRIAATAANASQYIQELVIAHGGGTVDYVEDAEAAMIDRMIRGVPKR